jgi:hypothetical protein
MLMVTFLEFPVKLVVYLVDLLSGDVGADSLGLAEFFAFHGFNLVKMCSNKVLINFPIDVLFHHFVVFLVERTSS